MMPRLIDAAIDAFKFVGGLFNKGEEQLSCGGELSRLFMMSGVEV